MNKDEILEHVRKEYGDSSIFTVDNHLPEPVEVISSGSFIIDYQVLGVGGFPRGRSTMIAGAEGSGKTTVSLHAAANAQKQDLLVAYVNAEHKLDLTYAAALGVDITDLIVVQPRHLDDGLGVIDLLCKRPEMGLIIYDSIPALGMKAEYEEEEFLKVSADYGKRADLTNRFFRRNIYAIREHGIALLLVNQLRDNISTSGFSRKKTRTPGGRGLKHYSSILLELAYTGKLKDGENIIGETVNAYTSKNNVALPFRSGEFNIYSGRGIDPVGDIITAAGSMGVMSKRGSWYTYDNQTIGQGLRLTTEALKNDAELLSIITQETKTKWLNGR